MLVAGPLTVIALQLVVSFIYAEDSAIPAIHAGNTDFRTGLVFVDPASHGADGHATLIIVSLGEITQSPRYYEYISRLAPPGQQGTYMGFAFMPIGIGSLIGGWFGGKLIHHFGEVTHQPGRIWWAVTAVGVATAALPVDLRHAENCQHRVERTRWPEPTPPRTRDKRTPGIHGFVSLVVRVLRV